VSLFEAPSTDGRSGRPEPPVPLRAILTTIGLVLATLILLYVVMQIRQILTWIIIAAFFAVALSPLVGWFQRHLFPRHRSLATLVVFVLVLLVIGGIASLFIVPLVNEGKNLATQLPDVINQAKQGRGPIGDLLRRTNALHYVQTHQTQIRSFATGLTTPAAGVLKGIVTGVAGALTIFVLAYLMVLEGPRIVDSSLNLFEPERSGRIRAVAADCARSITGYISGNLLISVVCGVLTWVVLFAFGVQFAVLIAVFVALVDLIPMVGATIGAVAGAAAAFVHSVPAGIAVVVFFVVYQQLENHLLQPVIYARTVKLNPLTVIVAILVAAELAGILGALLAIPVASMIQVIVRDLWDHRRGRPKTEPTVGTDQRPADAIAKATADSTADPEPDQRADQEAAVTVELNDQNASAGLPT
jgi:predicted PurR-regulated permease PerM